MIFLSDFGPFWPQASTFSEYILEKISRDFLTSSLKMNNNSNDNKAFYMMYVYNAQVVIFDEYSDPHEVFSCWARV